VVVANAGTEPATVALAIPELAGRRLVPCHISGLAAGAPVDVAGDGGASLDVAARSGIVLTAAG
jgi:hypothetical protein